MNQQLLIITQLNKSDSDILQKHNRMSGFFSTRTCIRPFFRRSSKILEWVFLLGVCSGIRNTVHIFHLVLVRLELIGPLKGLYLWPSHFLMASHHELLSCKRDTLGKSAHAQNLKRWPKLAFYMICRIHYKLGLLGLFCAGDRLFLRGLRLFPSCHHSRILNRDI